MESPLPPPLPPLLGLIRRVVWSERKTFRYNWLLELVTRSLAELLNTTKRPLLLSRGATESPFPPTGTAMDGFRVESNCDGVAKVEGTATRMLPTIIVRERRQTF